ncbi:MAG: 4-alpha-glucanotransferase [Oscillospiraceae bacterium]|jgi:4-alpha-glucanotransferase|nr:4-alpha-glucanotransferase [Oscillospiraceae bacterium]
MKRISGVVLHITSLPGPYGIGTMGARAGEWIDFLHSAGQRVWQILPLSPTGFADSPYQSCSAMAGNPYLIDLDALIGDGLLTREEAGGYDFGGDPDYVDYGLIYQNRMSLLRKAYGRGKGDPEAAAFAAAHKSWLPDYALYMALKRSFGMTALSRWPDRAIVSRDPDAMRRARETFSDEIEFHSYVQYLFFKQWKALKAYANERGVLIMGDLPIYVAEDSADVWARPELFQLKGPAKPSRVAGVPPDFYSATGQLWGNPLYDWEYHKKTDYKWWRGRIRHARDFYDIIRIDHFRGFHTYWSVGANAKTAISGRWVKGPGLPFVEKLKTALPSGSLVAEDLGDMGGTVRQFFANTGLPGMKVLVYAFDPDNDSEYLPHNAPKNSVCYTSTHDSPPFVDWLYGDAGEGERELAFAYLRLREDEGLGWGAVKAVWGSPAGLAMAPFQDILGLGRDARINVPATVGGNNWRWRVREEAFNERLALRLLEVTKTYKRG